MNFFKILIITIFYHVLQILAEETNEQITVQEPVDLFACKLDTKQYV